MTFKKSFLHKRGFVGLYVTIVILILAMGMIASISFAMFAQQKVIQNLVQSAQAHYTAESGAEDALVRLARGMTWSSPYSFSMGAGGPLASVTISPIFSGARTITVEGDSLSRIRKSEIVYEISGSTPGFFYGAQVGDNGLEMGNNSRVVGNVFTNGDVDGGSGTEITGTIQVAGVGGILRDVNTIGGDAFADVCDNSDITGVLHGSSQSSCSFSSFDTPYVPVAPIPLPIPDTQIDDWEGEAGLGGTIGTTVITGPTSLGPVRIAGDLVVNGGEMLTVTGTIFVTGTITVQNNGIVELDSGYGTTSGIIIAEGVVTLQNNSISRGSGQAGSYLMYISKFSAGDALVVQNNAQADIVYTNNGDIFVKNNAQLHEVTGYGIRLDNNAEITYEIGLASAMFTSGPGGGWQVTSWKEIP